MRQRLLLGFLCVLTSVALAACMSEADRQMVSDAEAFIRASADRAVPEYHGITERKKYLCDDLTKEGGYGPDLLNIDVPLMASIQSNMFTKLEQISCNLVLSQSNNVECDFTVSYLELVGDQLVKTDRAASIQTSYKAVLEFKNGKICNIPPMERK